jgi:hypothetical protein
LASCGRSATWRSNDAYALSFEQAIEEESRSQTISAQGSRAAIEGALKKKA